MRRFAVVLVAVAAGCASRRDEGATDRATDKAPVQAPAQVADSANARVVVDTAPHEPGKGDASRSESSRPKIGFVGTSLTAGLGLDAGNAFPAMIQRKIDSAGFNYDVVNAGVSGETTNGLLSRLDGLVRDNFDIVVLESGANDGLRGVPVETVKQDLQTALDRIKTARPSARVVLVQMEALPNYGPQYTRAFHNIYPELAKANGVRLLPFLLDGVAGHAELNQGDGVHPNLAGERIVADNVWKGLRPLLDQPHKRL